MKISVEKITNFKIKSLIPLYSINFDETLNVLIVFAKKIKKINFN